MKISAMKVTGGVILLIAIGFVTTNFIVQKNQKTKQAYIYKNLVDIIDSFHTEIKTLSPSISGKDQLQEELRKMKTYAQGSREKIKYLAVEGHSTGNLSLNEAIEKSDKYLSGFEQLANLSIDEETLKAKSKSMLENLENFRVSSQLFGSPDEGDTSEAISRVTKLSKNFDKARKGIDSSSSSPRGNGDRVIIVNSGGNYWSNPAYSDYRNDIFQIVAEYNQGRKSLSRVLSHYDRGLLTDSDRNQWNIELNKRRNLLDRVNSLSGEIPPFSIYKEHHSLLQQMLSNAIDAMECFSRNESYSNRKSISQISSRNTAIMNRLKRFYGIR